MQNEKLSSTISRLISLGIIALASNGLSAQTIDLQTAMDKAKALQIQRNPQRAGNRGKDSALTEPRLVYTSQDQSHTYYYAFDYPEGGYAIIGGDAAAREVLGFTDEGQFDLDNMPDGLKYLLKYYEQDIAYAIEHPMMTNETEIWPEVPAYDPHTWFSISPRLKTQWNQGYPYNSKLPKTGFQTGCVATAAAQVMKYYNYPTQGIGYKEYTRKADGVTYTAIADFGNTTYDWAHMLNQYSLGEYNEEESRAVGTLMYHAGVANDMYYGYSSSDAFYPDTKGLQTYFGYSPNAQYVSRREMEDYGWDQIIYNELYYGHPVFYTATADVGGHAFVVDGYDSNSATFHINWGWGGSNDGYYSLIGNGYLGPSSSWSFERDQMAWIGMVPNTDRYATQNVLGLKIDKKKAEVALGGKMKLNADPWPANAQDKTVTWSSDDPTIATVDENGVVTGLMEGITWIHASSGGERARAICELRVLRDGEFIIGSDDIWIQEAPFGNNYEHSIALMLYRKEEMGQSCLLSSISFLVNRDIQEYYYRPTSIEIWMGLTEETELDTDNLAAKNCILKKVYSRDECEFGLENGWDEFELDEAFYYDNQHNLLVIVTQNSEYSSAWWLNYAAMETDDTLCIYQTSSSMVECENAIESEDYEISYARPVAKFKMILDLMGNLTETIFWDYSMTEGKLHIYGTGSIPAYNSNSTLYSLSNIIHEVNIDEGITGINLISYVGKECQSVSIPSTIENLSLYNGGSLRYITVAANNTVYSDGGGRNVLIDMSNNTLMACGVESNYIPDGITSISQYCFMGNKSASLILPNSVTTISSGAFMDAEMKELFIPDAVSSIGEYTTRNCSNLTSIIVGRNNQTYDSRNNCNAIIKTSDNNMIAACRTTILPRDITNIRQEAFSPQVRCKAWDIPESLKRINTGIIPEYSKTKIEVSMVRLSTASDRNIFSYFNYDNLRRLYSPSPTPASTYSNDFRKNNNDRESEYTLYVPQGCIDSYKSKIGWKNFKTILEYCTPSILETIGTMLYSLDVNTRRGEQVLVPLYLKNEQTIKGFDATLELPEGVVPAKDSKGKPVLTFDEDRCDESWQYTASWSDKGLIVHGETTGNAINPGEGIVAYVCLDITLNACGGGQLLQLSNLGLKTGDGTKLPLLPYVSSFAIGHYLAGDINQDGEITAEDAEGIAGYINGNAPSRFVEELADPNHDGKVSISDVTCDVEKMK